MPVTKTAGVGGVRPEAGNKQTERCGLVKLSECFRSAFDKTEQKIKGFKHKTGHGTCAKINRQTKRTKHLTNGARRQTNTVSTKHLLLLFYFTLRSPSLSPVLHSRTPNPE